MTTRIGRRAVLLGPVLALSPTIAEAAQQYSNAQYGFSFAVPEGWELHTPESPRPQHGALLNRGDRSIAVGAAYDALLLGSAEAAMREFLQESPLPRGGEISAPRPVALGPLQGERVQSTIGQRFNADVIAYRAMPQGDTAIIYNLALRSDLENRGLDVESFDRIMKSFKMLPLGRSE